MTKSILHRLIDIQFSLIQILVPAIEAAWGAEDGYLLVRDLGDQLRRVMRELESLDAWIRAQGHEVARVEAVQQSRHGSMT